MRLTTFFSHAVGHEKIAPHRHTVYEAHYVAAGTGYWKIGSEKRSLGAGDFFLVLPGQEHFVSSHKDGGLSQILFFVAPDESDETLFDQVKKKWAKGKVFPVGTRQAYFFETLRRRSESKGILPREWAASAFAHFLYDLLMRSEVPDPGAPGALVEELLKTMHQNIRKDFSLKDEARRMGKSEAWMIRSFKSAMGVPPAHHYLRLKIEAAAESLRIEEKTASRIGEEYGFRDAFYFSKLFKRYTGLSPSAFRKRGV